MKQLTLREPEPTTAARRYLHVFVLIDALGWRLLEGRDFLSDLLPHRTPLRTVLGYSSGAIPTILTGLPPALTGHWNLFYYDPAKSPFRWLRHFSFLPDRVMDHRVTCKLMKELGRRVLGMGPLFECFVSPRFLHAFNWVEKRNIYARGGIGGAASIFDQLEARGIPQRDCSDREIFRRASRDLDRGESDFFFLYLSEMDHELHDHCGDNDHLDRRLAWYAESLRRLFEQSRQVDPEVTFTVFSDHGMTSVHHHHDLVKEVESLNLVMPDDYLAVYDSTMARFWFFSDRAKREICERLSISPCGRILSDEELRELGVLFPDRRYGESIFLLHPGWMLAKSDFNGPQWMPVGMHGYHPNDPDSDAVFLSNRKSPIRMRSIGDVYQCMLEAAG